MSEFLHFGQHLDADQVSAFIDHALPPHEQEELLAHLAVCAECRETVALSSPPSDAAPLATVPATTVKEKRKRWFWGLAVLTPAAAAVALTAVFLVAHFTARPHGGEGSPAPVAKLEPPRTAPSSSNAPTHGAHSPKQSVKKSQPENPHEPTAHSPSVERPQATEAPRPGEAPAESPHVEGGLAPEPLAEAPPQPRALPDEERPQVVLKGRVSDQSAPDEKERFADLRLPGGATPFSVAMRGPQILAIDAHNAVYLSNDDGATWTPIQVPWKSRAVKAELVSYSSRSGRRKRSSANGTSSFGEGAGAAPASVVQPAPPAAAPTAQAPAFPVAAQNAPSAAPGSLTGTVTDRTGTVIPHASVVVIDPVSHATRTTETDAGGQFRIDGLAPGAYDLEAHARGFKTETIHAVQVAAAQVSVSNFTLDVGAAAQTVTVQSASPTLETSSAVLNENIDGQASQSPRASTRAQSAPLFQITTENGDHWTSADGITWRRR
jgi:hypothetical protein